MTACPQIMEMNWRNGHLAEGLWRFQAGEYFAAHEEWEIVWLKADEPEKTFLQGVIQVAAALHHYKRGNRQGTMLLLHAALRRLEMRPEFFGGIAVGEFRADIRKCLEKLERGEDTRGSRFPRHAFDVLHPDSLTEPPKMIAENVNLSALVPCSL